MFFVHAVVVFLCAGMSIKTVRGREDWAAAFFVASGLANAALMFK